MDNGYSRYIDGWIDIDGDGQIQQMDQIDIAGWIDIDGYIKKCKWMDRYRWIRQMEGQTEREIDLVFLLQRIMESSGGQVMLDVHS